MSAHDRRYIEHAVREAKRRNPRHPAVVFDFIRDLLLKKADYIPEEERGEHLKFVGKFQQVTSPVTAKGIEDTALYIYNRLVSLNEVGGEPDKFGVAPDALHRWLANRAERVAARPLGHRPRTTPSAARTCARASTCCRSCPAEWRQATGTLGADEPARRASSSTASRTRAATRSTCSTRRSIGTWPFEPMSADEEREYRERIRDYMLKTMREAKVFTSWLNPSEPHEQAMTRFVEMVLSPNNAAFRRDFLELRAARGALRHLQLARAARDQDRRARRARLLPGHRALGLQPRRSGQPPSRRLRGSAARCSPSSTRSHPPTDASIAARAAASIPRTIGSSCSRRRRMLRVRRAASRPVPLRTATSRWPSRAARRDTCSRSRASSDERQAIVAVPRLVATLQPDGERAARRARLGRHAHRGAGRCAALLPAGVHRRVRAGDRAGRPPVRSAPPTRSSTSRSRSWRRR